MSKTKSTPEASAEGAQEHATSTGRDLLGDVLGAIILAVKFPLTPVPPNIVAQMDDALAALRAGIGDIAASAARVGDVVASLPDDATARLSKLEDFVDRLTADLPAQLEQMQAAIKALESTAKAATDTPPPSGDRSGAQGEQK